MEDEANDLILKYKEMLLCTVFCFETESYVSHANLKFHILLLQFLKGWGCSHVPPCPVSRALLETWIPGPTKAADGIFLIG